jgi:hypothetical protein
MYELPVNFTIFNAYLFLKDADYNVTGVEFMLITPEDPSHALFVITDFSFPQEGTLNIGDPFSGMAIVYWPPLNGFTGDPLLLLNLECLTVETCYCHGGDMMDYPITVVAHPESGELHGTYAPDNEFFSIIGFTSYLCPYFWAPYLINVVVEDENRIRGVFDTHISDASATDESRYLVIEHSTPPDTLLVVSASRYSDKSVQLTLERNMTDGMTYTLLATHICRDEFEYTCGDSQWEYLFDAEIGTMLQSFSAERSGTGIVITWRMAESKEEIDFHVLRCEGGNERFTEIPSTFITREGLDFRFTDRCIDPGRTYRYRIEYVENGESHLLFETQPIETPPAPLTLHQNVPNPFNPSTAIQYYLPEPCRVTIDIFDINGKRVARLVDRMEDRGLKEVEWNGYDERGGAVTSGVYLYLLTAGKETAAKKMVLLK